MDKSVLEGLTAPELVVDVDILDRNISRMAAVNASGFALRPHAKSHKCSQIAWLRLEAGARGLPVATERASGVVGGGAPGLSAASEGLGTR
ncbi:hypothetical protein [Streptomyces coffeae]|uniref:Alanine racemase N-terminal domain-containing protein n=1 Tax=Streptomyces coffeae TaxID=621382 RepID=A0ABS1NKN5_9ACTN|nr:hypothetical protein [Streptomyces coffeae]MBL1100584.1 hypothetical protein [Streptomyces coffeae]